MTNTESTCAEIRKTILSIDKPFCIIDLFNKFSLIGITNRDLILEILEELYERDLVEYRYCGDNTGNTKWAFCVT